MKFCIFTFAVFLTPIAFAKNMSSRAPETLTDGAISGVNHIYFSVIPYAQDAGFAIAYEKDIGENVGFGGQLTVLPEDDQSTPQAVGMVALGAQVRFHYVVKMFDVYVAPGLNFMKMELGTKDDTTIGGALAAGTLVQISQQFAMGAEFSTFQPWFNEDFYVLARQYYFTSSLTARLTF